MYNASTLEDLKNSGSCNWGEKVRRGAAIALVESGRPEEKFLTIGGMLCLIIVCDVAIMSSSRIAGSGGLDLDITCTHP